MRLSIPPPTQPAVDPRTGYWTEPWYRFFNQLAGSPAQVSCLFKTVSFDTAGIGSASTVGVGQLPAGSLHIQTAVRIKTVFNAGTTNVLTVGTATDGDHFIEAGDVVETALGLTLSDRNIGEVFTSDTTIYVRYEQTGTAATTGEADIVFIYATGA